MMHWRRRMWDYTVCLLVFTGCLWPACARAGHSTNPHHGFLGGPWEIVVQLGHQGDTLRLPLLIADESKPQTIDSVLPVRNTPIKVRIKQYVPDLTWETVAVDDPNGGPVARLTFKGESLNQQLWLSARDAGRQTVSSHIGGVTIRELPETDRAAEVLSGLVDPDAVGIVNVWPGEAEGPQAYVAKPDRAIELPDGQGTLSMLQYMPHYSIDRQTKEVVNRSETAVNPAFEIRLEHGGQEYHRWLWSKFAASPHKKQSLPFPIKFVDFHLGREPGQYILATANGMQPHLFHIQGDRRCVEKAELGRSYAFKDERYAFVIDQVYRQAKIENRWKNNSEMLLHPAIVVEIGQDGAYQEAVLELNKPYHNKTKYGTLVVFYRRVP